MTCWGDDKLGFEKSGDTFTALVQSITDTKVISIEAPFGRGKTFFRTNWAAQLREAGEVVIEIDAQQSDHSGDPVVTFLGALLAAVPSEDAPRRKKAWASARKIAAATAKAATGAVLRQGAEHVFDALENDDGETSAAEQVLEETIEGLEKGLRDYLGSLISDQLRAEEARKALPEQLDALRGALTEGRPNDRVVILIDELDRCHPDYALALLEAMKLVFARAGFVFVLMVNREHLEAIAAHRFGRAEGGEPYLDKFVDMRLRLEATPEAMGEAARALTLDLPLGVPFGEGPEFTVERAAQVAAEIAAFGRLSMRQIERVLLKVELALRVYHEEPIDCALIVGLAFAAALERPGDGKFRELASHLPRAKLTPVYSFNIADRVKTVGGGLAEGEHDFLSNDCRCFQASDIRERYDASEKPRDVGFILEGIAPNYIPIHQAMLDAVHSLVPPEQD